MATVKVYDQERQEVGEIALAPEVFDVVPRAEILNFVIRSQMAANRSGTHHTKTRGQVSGGGVKPWKQKGTGRARAGSNRSPIWRGGAIIFGPQPRTYGFKVNSKIRALAMKMALSSRVEDGGLLIVKAIDIAEPKTKLFAKVAKQLELDKALVVLPEKNETLIRASNNLPNVTTTTPDQLNVWQILKHRQLVLLEDAVSLIEARFAAREKK
ncbi:MAG: 50S ribosomal protein L4 [Desulfovibrio sp.]|nr:50S ribosomal protein L4 [Desulfovibrio sp.]